MPNLPQKLNLEQLSTKWASIINPILAKPLVNGQLLKNNSLVVGANSINHKLGRDLQGWIIIGINGVANIYDTQATNQTPQLTLNLVSDAIVSVNLWVF